MEASEQIITEAPLGRRIPTVTADAIRPMECLREGRALIENHYWLLTGICFVGYLLSGMAPLYLLYGPMLCGISYCLLRLKQGETFEFVDLFKGFDHFGPGFFVGLAQMLPAMLVAIPLYLIAILANVVWATQNSSGADYGDFRGLFVVGFAGAWLLVIMVSALTHLLFAFSFCLIVEWKVTAKEALKLSAQAVRANLSGAIGLFLLTGLVMLAGALLCGVGVYLAVPVSHAAWTIAYRKVFPPYPHHLDIPPDPPVWEPWRPETAVPATEPAGD